MKHAYYKIFVLTVTVPFLIIGQAVSQSDTLWAATDRFQPLFEWQHGYHQTLTLKLFLSQAEFDGKYKRKDNGISTIYLTIADALEVIKKIDNLTAGIPKIIYLVGWQYNGHDSKYPAFFEGNEKLKRPQDKNALESIRWLMREAKHYHTTVSLHINMFDAYEDSPLWEEYVRNDIIAKDADGTLIKAEWGYPISYAQEWATGFAQKRIDRLCELLPVQEAGTIHIDAFHTWAPMPVTDANGKTYIDLDKKPVSQYLKFTSEDETEAQRKIFGYWASKGIDVTSEGVDFLRQTDFAGLQPMAWWFVRSASDYLRYPAAYYTGGVDNGEWGRLFGSSMHGEQEIKLDPQHLEGMLEKFCLHTVPWYFLNRLNRLYMVQHKESRKVVFSDKVESVMTNDRYMLLQNGKVLVEHDNVLIPALWLPRPTLIAYSKQGYENKHWLLPDTFTGFGKLGIYEVTPAGKRFLYTLTPEDGGIKLSMRAGAGYIITPLN